jgi:ATP-binding cassette subfamily B protein
MNSVARGRTTVLIAYRLQTARHADQNLVLSGGRVVEVGTHDQLVEADGQYAAMWQAFGVATRA